ncbi:hypothetical protein acsn021_38910 [Anaerocolumna cellulosilytica]|uniref:Uncharacterized protein n=1 Tax=Anaerocolumna cellulosilytica TaxID=433286 RepID=A0A6S6RAQ0_9FIRM|nr:hypothetical protein [Anaerocolumna cellulosilytica]MBB5196291.1 hypothetical protein [Anaerocolumna cellulosilytica]BCJ96322.1 hypothetical protein acsn021_38910 [Anaerocolumna cellulosilytica]
MNNNGKEITNTIGFLLKELHKEWDRSGIATASVVIAIEEIKEVNQVLFRKISETQHLVEANDMTWKESVVLSKKCYVLLRLVRKIKAKEGMKNQKVRNQELSIPLDKEELKLFKELFGAKIK